MVGALGDTKDIVNIGPDKIKPIKQFVHLFLEDVWAVTQSHWDALVFEFAKVQYDGAELLGVFVQLQMVVSHVEIQTSAMLESL